MNIRKDPYFILVFIILFAALQLGHYVQQHFAIDKDIADNTTIVIAIALGAIAAKFRPDSSKENPRLQMPLWQIITIIALMALAVGASLLIQKAFHLSSMAQIGITIVLGFALTMLFGKTRLFRNPALEAAQTIAPAAPEDAAAGEEKLVVSLEPALEELKRESKFRITKKGLSRMVNAAAVIFIILLAVAGDKTIRGNIEAMAWLAGISTALAVVMAVAVMAIDKSNARKMLAFYEHGATPMLTLTPQGITCPLALFPTFPFFSKVHNYLTQSGKTSLHIRWGDIQSWDIVPNRDLSKFTFGLKVNNAAISPTPVLVLIRNFLPEKEREIIEFARRFLKVPMLDKRVGRIAYPPGGRSYPHSTGERGSDAA